MVRTSLIKRTRVVKGFMRGITVGGSASKDLQIPIKGEGNTHNERMVVRKRRFKRYPTKLIRSTPTEG